MKASLFIHVLLLVSLCVGQIATNGHIVSHLQFPVGHADAQADSDAQADNDHGHSHEHHRHHDLVDLRNQLTAANDPDPASADCSIYHVYIGLSAIPAVHSVEIASALPCLHRPVTTNPVHARLPADSHPIRGPPSFS